MCFAIPRDAFPNREEHNKGSHACLTRSAKPTVRRLHGCINPSIINPAKLDDDVCWMTPLCLNRNRNVQLCHKKLPDLSAILSSFPPNHTLIRNHVFPGMGMARSMRIRGRG